MTILDQVVLGVFEPDNEYDGKTCLDMAKDNVDRQKFVQDKCNVQNGFIIQEALENLQSHYIKNCVGKSSCEVTIDRTKDIIDACLSNNIKKKGEIYKGPNIILSVPCGYIKIPLSDYSMDRGKFGILVVFIDMLVIIAVIIYIYVLQERQKEFIDQFNQQVIEMSDFAIRVKNLPTNLKYDDNENILRAQLWRHFQKILVSNSLEYQL